MFFRISFVYFGCNFGEENSENLDKAKKALELRAWCWCCFLNFENMGGLFAQPATLAANFVKLFHKRAQRKLVRKQNWKGELNLLLI